MVWLPTAPMTFPGTFIVGPVTPTGFPSMYHFMATSRVPLLSLSSVTAGIKTKLGVPAVVPVVGPVTVTNGAVLAAGVLTSTEAVPVAPPLSVTVRVIRNSSDAERETKVPLLTPVAVCNTFPKLDVRTITQSMSAAGIVPSSASKPRPVKSMVLPIRIADSIVANGGELVGVGVALAAVLASA